MYPRAQVHVEAAVVAARSGRHAHATAMLRCALEVAPANTHALAAATALHLDAAVAAAAGAGAGAGGAGGAGEEEGGDAYTHWHAALACADALLDTTEVRGALAQSVWARPAEAGAARRGLSGKQV